MTRYWPNDGEVAVAAVGRFPFYRFRVGATAGAIAAQLGGRRRQHPRELVIFAALIRAREAGRRDAARPARSTWSVQRPLAARFDGEVAGGAVADSTLVIFRFGATMELGRSGRSMMMMMTSASASGGDGGVAGSLSEVQRLLGIDSVTGSV